MVKPLTFKGDKKVKKRKRERDPDTDANDGDGPSRKQQQQQQAAPDEAHVENDDSWVSAEAVTDVSGPIMLVLPTTRPSALACDANGKVFAIPVENIVDDNPSSAEPHDARQVWIASRVAGTEHFRFKGRYGK